MLLKYGCLMESELHALIRFASSFGYCSFAAESEERSKQACGGALLFAEQVLRARHVASSTVREYQSVTAMIEGTAFSCIYQPPEAPRLPLVEHVQEGFYYNVVVAGYGRATGMMNPRRTSTTRASLTMALKLLQYVTKTTMGRNTNFGLHPHQLARRRFSTCLILKFLFGPQGLAVCCAC